MRHLGLFALLLAALALGTPACQHKSSDGAQKAAPTPGPVRARPVPPRTRPEPRLRERTAPARRPPRAARPAAHGNAFDLPNAPGVTPLDAATAKTLPLVNVPVSQVIAQARKHCRTHYYGLYLGGQKLGWAQMGCTVRTEKGQPVYERSSEMVMHAKIYASVVKIRSTTLARYAGHGAGELLSYAYVQQGVQQKKTLRITRKPEGWLVEQTYRAGAIRKPPTRKLVKRLDTTLGNGEAGVTTLLLEGKLRPGARYRFRDIDPEDAVVRDSAAQLLGNGEAVVRGVKVHLHKLEVLELHRKLRGVTLLDASGNWLDGLLQGTIRIRREEKATAKTIDPKAGDFGLGVVIKAPMNVTDPRRVRQMRVSLHGFLPTSLKASPRQRFVSKGPRAAELTVTRESVTGLPTTLLPQLERRFPKALAATPTIEAKNPLLVKLARRAIGAEKHALPAARKLNTFVYQYLRKSLSTNLDSALAIAKARAGDCTEHARLMVALCRAVGLPAREVGGVTWVPDLGGFGYHAWVEVWVGRWITADPSWNELPANATHIQMGGPNDVQWIGTLGALKVKVLDVKQE